MQFFDLQSSKKVAHRDRWAGCIPVHIPDCSCSGEVNPRAELFYCRSLAKSAFLQAAIDNNPVGAPERIMQLDQFSAGNIDQPMADGIEFAPHCPALIEDGMREEPAQATRMPELSNELQVVSGVGFMNASKAQAMVLANFSSLSTRIGLFEGKVIDQKDPCMVF